MRVLIDTNILISAILTNGTPFRAYMKAITHPNTAIICGQNVNELRRIFARKFPRKTEAMEQFLLLALQSVELVAVPEQPVPAEKKIRDAADRPILRAALASNADILLTGDKDFLEAGLVKPRILSAMEFLQL